MKISPITFISNNIKPNYKPEKPHKEDQSTETTYPTVNFLGYNIAFYGRVDKGLERFYDANKDRMPQTVKEYIENLDDKTKTSPIEAHTRAFELLEISNTIEDIKSAYPNEPLFENLINPKDSKAPRGILNSVKENEELLALSNQGILKDKSNLTVYLVKKIFLENKTLDEINQDLEKDLDEDFKADFRFKNTKSQYIYTSTLNSLGIKAPEAEYRASLRYTKDGYADAVGEKISQSQRAFWDSMAPEERTARNKKSVEKFEKWWYSHTKNEMLDMIADQTTALEMLKEFKKSQSSKSTKTHNESSKPRTANPQKTGSEKLSRDELFIRWATNNLKLYLENLSEAEKDTLHIKRMQRLAARWSQMSPDEKTDYISKMKSGSEPLRYTMIDAWNHSIDLIKDLSMHLKQNQIYKPSDLLYSTQEFSEFQSRVMKEFWEKYPEYSSQLGENIVKSQTKVQQAISNGTFEELKKQIMRDKNQRLKELDKFKQSAHIASGYTIEPTPAYIREFKDVYCKTLGGQLKNLPKEYINDYFNVIEKGFRKEQIEAWTRNLKGEPLSDNDYEILKEISTTEPANGARINRALEGALADTLYKCTGNPEVYKLSHSDMKVSLNQISRGEDHIDIISHKLNKHFSFPIKERKIDSNRIAMLYHQYKEPLSDNELSDIASEYFVPAFDHYEELKDYLSTYGRSINIIFSDKSKYPKAIKQAMFDRFIDNMPKELEDYPCFLLVGGTSDPFGREENINKLKFLLAKRFNFVPSVYMDNYARELAIYLRFDYTQSMYDKFLEACNKRAKETSNAKLAILPKDTLRTSDSLRTLAMEEALADVLYEATGCIDVYKLQFEELCDNIELFNSVKKFPSQTRYYTSISGDKMEISAKKKPNTIGLKQKYLDYINEIVDWVNTDVKNGNQSFEDLLFILNPDEDMPQKDEAVSQRIKLYNLHLIPDSKS